MKIVCVDNIVDGHHEMYLKGLSNQSTDEFLFIVPKTVDIELHKQIIISYDLSKRSFAYDIYWLKQVYQKVKNLKPDIVHFVYGDFWYRYFGIGFEKFKKFNTLITFHTISDDLKHKLGLKRLAHMMKVCVVHTETLYKQVIEWRMPNINQIEYPCFMAYVTYDMNQLKTEMGLPNNKIILSALGGTRTYKGLNYLLAALKRIELPFHLLIAGSEENFNREFIEDNIQGYRDNVTLILHKLSDEEFTKCLAVSDWIILPYRKSFSGASGPLAEGVMYRKGIVGPKSGSIGELLHKYHLGLCFESENIQSLEEVLKIALQEKFLWTEKAEVYRRKLDPMSFQKAYSDLYLKTK